MNPKQIIEKIRADKFWIGKDVPPDLREGAEFQRRNTTNACKRLSEELYDKESHFVLELIQNADDNTYPDGAPPSLSFKIEPSRIIVSNNEVGFAQKHVEALCQIGESTKVKENIKGDGYIGEKGIGFKSIFRVSSHPQIHSAGFHFFFKVDKDTSEPNYICPRWIEDPRQQVKAPGTTIVLPALHGIVFREDFYFKHIGPEILLFLRKLQALRVQSEAGTRAYTKKQLPNDISELSLAFTGTGATTRTKRHFMVVEHGVDVKGLGGERRKNFVTSKIHLAFGLKQSDEAWSVAADQRSSLFAYLPVRAYGFRFIVQGDFLLTSSRGSVDFALPWNAALARAIPRAFIDALRKFKVVPGVAKGYLEYLPRPNEVTDDGLEPIAEEIYTQLSTEECILSDSGKWRKPTDILIGNDDDKALIPNADLLTLLGKEYAAKDLAAKAVLEKLGCEDFQLSHLIDCLGHTEWVTKHHDSWFTELYRMLGSVELDEDDLQALRKLPILRLADGRTTTYRDQTFLPLTLGRQYGFESELQMLSAESSGTSAKEDEPVREFLYSLGIAEPSIEMIIERVVIPGCDSPLGNNGPSKAHLGHIRYLRDHWKQYLDSKQKGSREAARRGVTARLRLLSSSLGDSKALRALAPENLYLGGAYGNECPLEDIFGQGGILILSDCYIKSLDDDEISAYWTFFQDVGVAAVPRVNDSGDYDASDEVKKVISSSEIARRVALLATITKYWDRRYKNRSWLPTPKGAKRSAFFELVSAMKVPVRGGGLASMSETFLHKEDIYAAFKDTVKYIDLPPDVASEEVLKAAGVRTVVDFQAALLALKGAKSESKADPKRLATLYQLISVYASAHSEQLNDEFDTWDLVFNPADKKWGPPGQYFWKSSSETIDRHCGALSRHYGGLKDFFCDLLGVPEEPTLIQLHSTLQDISTVKAAKPESTLVKQIYLEISSRLEDEDSGEDHRKDVVRDIAAGLVLARDGRFLPAEAVLFDDDPELSSMFAEHPRISIMDSDYHNLPELQALLEACSIRTISEATERKLPATSSQHRSPELTALIHGRWPELMRYLRHTGERLDYKRLKSDPSLPARLQVRLVETLRAKYVLEGITVERAERSAHDDGAILLDSAAGNDFDRLSLETCRLLELDPKEANFFYMILSRPAGDNLDAFFDNRGIPPLPIGELAPQPEPEPAEYSGGASQIEEVPTEPTKEQAPLSAGFSTHPPVAPPHENIGEDQTPSDTSAAATFSESKPQAPGTPRDRVVVEPEHWPTGEPTIKEIAANPQAQPTPVLGDKTASTTDHSAPGSSGPASTEQDSVEAWPEGRAPSSAPHPRAPRIPNSDEPRRGQPEARPSQGRGQMREPGEHSRSGPFQQVYIAASVSGTAPPREDESPEAIRRGDLGEDCVVELERQAGWDAKRMPRNNPGYDIISRRGEESKYIEVKSTGGEWSGLGVGATHKEFTLALELGEKYWLYVVEHVENPVLRRCTRIQDPARKVTRYLFDDSWRQLAAQDTPDDSWVDSKIDLGDGRVAKVLRVRGGGQLKLLDVALENGERKQVPFDPNKMRKL